MNPRQRRASKDSRLGFTLIELLIVTVVLGIIASIAIVAVAGALDRAKQRATMADLRIVGRALESYIVDHNFAPSDAGGLAALVPVLIPYQTNVVPVTDHWKRDISYVTNGQVDYTLESYGRDGVPGADIDWSTRFDYDLDIVLANGLFVASPE